MKKEPQKKLQCLGITLKTRGEVTEGKGRGIRIQTYTTGFDFTHAELELIKLGGYASAYVHTEAKNPELALAKLERTALKFAAAITQHKR